MKHLSHFVGLLVGALIITICVAFAYAQFLQSGTEALMSFLPFLMALGGFALLMIAGDKLVDGAVSLGKRLNWSAVFVGIIIIGFGTSLPEVLTAIAALQAGAPDMALGNVIGSNTANMGLIFGFALVVSAVGLRNKSKTTYLTHSRNDYAFMLAVLLAFSALLYAFPMLFWVHGAVLLVVLFAYLLLSFTLGSTPGESEAENQEAAMPWWQIAVFVLGGLAGLALGAKLLVSGATDIARGLGVSERVIGLTMIAIGTSLPELAAAYAAAKRQQLALTAGNILGSNAFNCGAAVGIPLLFGVMSTEAFRSDIWVMLAFNLLVLPLFIFRVGAPWHRLVFGGALLAGYVGYMVSLA